VLQLLVLQWKDKSLASQSCQQKAKTYHIQRNNGNINGAMATLLKLDGEVDL
jgi:hypothetical protein